MDRNTPLTCSIEDGVLTMRIGVEVLAHAVKLNPHLAENDDGAQEMVEPEIPDADKFAAEILPQLRMESKDGITVIHEALDKAAFNAIEYGAESVKMPDEIIRERKAARRLARKAAEKANGSVG